MMLLVAVLLNRVRLEIAYHAVTARGAEGQWLLLHYAHYWRQTLDFNSNIYKFHSNHRGLTISFKLI